MFEELGAKRPFDGSDAVYKGAEDAIPARSWHHVAARAAMAYVLYGGELSDTFRWPEVKRVVLINDLCDLIDVHCDEDGEAIAELIVSRLREDETVDAQFRAFLTEDELEQMAEDIGAVIVEIREKTKAR
jgi:hypothetical protein